MTNPDNLVPRSARNELFYFIARACMIFATVIGLPICGWMLSRAVATADEISKQVSSQGTELRLLSDNVKYRFENITDHETRLRLLERRLDRK